MQKCLKRLFKWRQHELGADVEWDPEYSFSAEQCQPWDFLTVEERRQIREAAPGYKSIPHTIASRPPNATIGGRTSPNA